MSFDIYPEKFFIYVIKEKKTGEIIYVGRTGDIKARISAHKNTWMKGIFDDYVFVIVDEVYWFESTFYETVWMNYLSASGCNLKNKYIPKIAELNTRIIARSFIPKGYVHKKMFMYHTSILQDARFLGVHPDKLISKEA